MNSSGGEGTLSGGKGDPSSSSQQKKQRSTTDARRRRDPVNTSAASAGTPTGSGGNTPASTTSSNSNHKPVMKKKSPATASSLGPPDKSYYLRKKSNTPPPSTSPWARSTPRNLMDDTKATTPSPSPSGSSAASGSTPRNVQNKSGTTPSPTHKVAATASRISPRVAGSTKPSSLKTHGTNGSNTDNGNKSPRSYSSKAAAAAAPSPSRKSPSSAAAAVKTVSAPSERVTAPTKASEARISSSKDSLDEAKPKFPPISPTAAALVVKPPSDRVTSPTKASEARLNNNNQEEPPPSPRSSVPRTAAPLESSARLVAPTASSKHKVTSPTKQRSSTAANNGRPSFSPSARRRKTATTIQRPKKTPSLSSSPCCPKCGDACTCGADCPCTEELCQCQAYQVWQSVTGAAATTAATTRSGSRKQCCRGKRPAPPPPPLEAAGDALAAAPATTTTTTSTAATPTTDDDDELQRADLSITGMTCSMCSQAVERAVRQLSTTDDSAVVEVDVSLTTDSALIAWRAPLTVDEIRRAIEDVGYEVDEVRLLSAPGNDDENNGNDNEETVEERWERYRRRQNSKVGQRRCAFLWALVGTLPIVTLTMVLPHIVPNLFHHKHVHIPYIHKQFDLEALVLWALATPVQFLCGFDFYKMAWYGFQAGTAGMDVLVALGTTASYGYAVSGAWKGDEHAAHFFETSAVLICFVLAGKWMQAAAVRRTSEALTQLMELQSPTAVKIAPLRAQQQPFNPLKDAYREQVVDIHEISVGDTVKVIRGASIPADGRVLYGEVSVDESMVTGESVPILKTPGSLVLGGTICVESGVDTSDEESGLVQKESMGAAFIEVTGVGSSTALSQIIELVQHAQTQAVPIQTFADQVSAVFVPAVCTISVITYLVWYALCSSNVVPEAWYRVELGEDAATFSLMFAIACLVISCPCALGLATPTAVMVGTGVGARCGVLMKGGETLEIASKVDAVVFDKTGTLTLGTPCVTDFIPITGKKDNGKNDKEQETADKDYLLWLLGSLERTSEHPLARAIVTYAEEQLSDALDDNPFVQPSKFRGVTGRGASGTILGNVSVSVGNRSFASVQGLKIPQKVDALMKRLEEDGKTAILASVDGNVRAVLGIADELKPGAADALAYLRETMDVDVWMVTGDNSRTAGAISRQLGLPANRVISEALPAAKLEKVSALQDEGWVVAMVGDGVNDSPALAQANVGMSLGTGAEIATEASDMVLVKGHVADVCTALHLSRAIFSRIRWNLFWSLVYNSLGIPIAAGAFYPLVHTRLPPTVAAVAMALSSVSVVLSSLTLRLYRPPRVEANGDGGRIRATTVWARRSRPFREASREDENDMTVNLLSRDHLANSELTVRVDNRTANRMEEG